MRQESKAVLIAGPTASGKSALALALGERCNGVIINSDSMQVYRDLRVITARPTVDEEALLPHRLYGHVDAAVNYSVGQWLVDAAAAFEDAQREGRLAIFVGGTGLYFRALTRGLARVPAVAPAIRDSVRQRLERDGVEALYDELCRRDPVTASRLNRRDKSRIARALEVFEATGRSLIDWQRQGQVEEGDAAGQALLPPEHCCALFLAPDRDDLYARIRARFAAMLDAGAAQEVARLALRRLDPLLPAMKAHGVPALIRHLKGEISLEEASRIGSSDTCHYAKRQFTWFRNQLPEFDWVRPDQAAGWLEGRV